ncbi:MerR family transcriptional regulator [Acaryochloris sp. CCMEE 5410]|uniref:MerR family transcriptional regulator n=1 Tax=Acaryochloris sp. CCMEE 5410 TaxID=310037 RepID=UPI00024843E8|nr:MerR family transcriptional regulator [Acaryochloris sp. CCMEE 5410]KAI9129922.1 MerR family transcriptional regulator [Acaryochloris sp. CCMEE 5410]
MSVNQGLLIGELSRQADVPVSTIRYYESQGLLKAPERTRSQYRVYSQEAKERLQFIQKAKRFRLSLEEIKQILALSEQGIAPCKRVSQMLKQHLVALDQHIQEMVVLRQELANRYQRIRTVLPDDDLEEFPEELCNGSVCGFIEHDDDNHLLKAEPHEA